MATILLNADVSLAEGAFALTLLAAMQYLVAKIARRPMGRAVVTASDGEPHAVIDGILPAEGRAEVLALPLRTPDVVIGVLGMVRPTGHPFSRNDIDVARSFADQAAAALHIGELRADRERLRVLEDRERIARDLHDSVIQDLFAAGMALDSIQHLISAPLATARVAATVDQLDATIKQIRTTIFDLETGDPDRGVDLDRVQQLADRLFKLGELGLFVESLARQTQVSERTEFAELVAGIKSALDAAKGFDTLASDYHAFVVGQLRSAP